MSLSEDGQVLLGLVGLRLQGVFLALQLCRQLVVGQFECADLVFQLSCFGGIVILELQLESLVLHQQFGCVTLCNIEVVPELGFGVLPLLGLELKLLDCFSELEVLLERLV